jgi:hypothetical protein
MPALRPYRWNRRPQGLKPDDFARLTARLKPCPDVKREFSLRFLEPKEFRGSMPLATFHADR